MSEQPSSRPQISAVERAEAQAVATARARTVQAREAEAASRVALSIAEVTSRFDTLADYSRQHSAYQCQNMHDFAQRWRSEAKRFAEEYLAAERRRLAETERALADLVG